MATYRPLRLGIEPRVVTFARWLLRDRAVARSVTVLRSAPGATLWMDGHTAVLILPDAALGIEAIRGAFYALIDEITVYRLSTHDDTRSSGRHAGLSDQVLRDRIAAGVRVRAS